MAFNDIAKKSQGVQLLQRSLARRRLGHAYLFTGHQLEELELLARTGLCQGIGHCDLPKKFGFHHGPDILNEWPHVAETFARCDVLCEINTAGLRKPVKEIYPSLAILKILRAAGVGLTLGSDSHRPQDIAADFAGALDLARAAGYEYLHKWKSPGVFAPVKIAELPLNPER